MITNEALEWSSDDESNFRAFLGTQTGQRLLPKLLESTPVLLSGGESNAIFIRNGEVRGWQAAASTLLAMAFRPSTASVDLDQTEYPSLTDDAKWPGEKLNKPA